MQPEQLNEWVTLYHADCMDVLPTLGKVDAVVTDPPYGIFDHGGKWGKKAELQWDKQAPDWIPSLASKCKSVAIWGGNYFALPPSRGWIVWHKRDSVPSAADVELCWTNQNKNALIIDQTISATNPERVGHPTQKPLKVMLRTIEYIGTPTSSTILDPFAGSGTTGIAAMLTGRKCILIEKDAKYCEVIRKRVREADAASPGKLFDPANDTSLFAEQVPHEVQK